VTRDRRLVLAIGLNVVIVVVQVVFGIVAHSLGLLSDAGHNLTDVAAIGMSLMAVRMARRSPTQRLSYGFHRSEVLVAQANAAIILLATGFIGFEAIRRLMSTREVHGGTVVAAAAAALMANAVAALILARDAHDLNMRSALLHLAGDAVASAGVVVAGLVIWLTKGTYWLDPAVSLAIGAVLAYRAVRLLGATTAVLMESTPEGMDIGTIADAVRSVDGVEEAHDIHVWSLSSDLHALSAHVVLSGSPTLAEAQAMAARIKELLEDRFAIGHATIEAECDSCLDASHSPAHVTHEPRPRAARLGHQDH
jgi:cobalt-zinc-cadmium efflux system protein